MIVVNAGGDLRAYEDRCPHQGNPLSDGCLEGVRLRCAYHLWEFDAQTGKGLNPADARLPGLPVRVEDDEVLVWVDDDQPHGTVRTR